ncbi:SEC-C metal-binding domain-containing protein (plasmid) [Nocardioides sp. R1-1]|uniref:SEC-C metal-binding domain-containing protein n=1 Tax=Nocardioides sp. R1-1 TaxID=3383502 RepID=UPI0038D0A9FF
MSIPAMMTEIAAAVEELLADGVAREPESIVEGLTSRGVDLGVAPDDTIADVLDDDELCPHVWELDERYVLLPALLRDRTFTHRLTAAEAELDFLNVSPDLEPVSLLTEVERYRRLTDGSAVEEVVVGYDDGVLAERGVSLDDVDECVWLLDRGVWGRLGASAGDLVGIIVRAEGFELTLVRAPGAPDGCVHAIASAASGVGLDEPMQIMDVVWLACADNPELFRAATMPLTALLDSAGLAWNGELLAPAGFDFGSWRVSKRVSRVAALHRLDEDHALAVVVITRLYREVADVVAFAQELEGAGEPLDELFQETDDGAAAPTFGPAEPQRENEREMAVRETLEFLRDPAVAESVLVETIGAGVDGAAALGAFAESLEGEAPSKARPALRWLRGKALDRLGEVIEAEQAFEAALTLDADWEPALYDLARYASDRGDAERGLSLLRRAGAPADDELVALLEQFRPTERNDIGRNQPCWCGSGRKYKVCHRGRESLQLGDRAAWLYQKAGAYLADGPWRGEIVEAATLRAQHQDDPMATYAAVRDPLVADVLLFEGGAFEAFLTERGVLLPDDERLLGDQWLLVSRSLFEVEDVRVGTGFTVRDLRTGDRSEVLDRAASRSLKVGMLICARLAPVGDTVQCFGGMEPVALHQRDDLIRLLDGEPHPLELIEFLSRRFAPPVLQNTEGDPLVLCEATLRSPDPAALSSRLDESYDRADDDSDAPVWYEHVVTHGLRRIRASLALEGDIVRIDANSVERFDRILNALSEMQPGLDVLEQTRRPAADAREAMSRAPRGGHSLSTLDAEDPAIAAAVEEMIHQHEQAWFDQPIPALDGATPRQAAADPTRRPDLIRLLDSFGAPSPGAMNADRLRAELGL